MVVAPTTVTSDIDLFSEDVLQDPFPSFKILRDLGPAAYLTRYELWFLCRYEQVRNALNDWQTFSSAQGIGLNEIINKAWTNALICLDPPEHTAGRKHFEDQLRPRNLKPVADTIDRRANELAERLLEMGTFDAVVDLAQDLPVNIVMDLIGWPEEGRDQLIEWAMGSFNAAGPKNERMYSSLPKLEGMFRYLTEVATPDNLTPGGFGTHLYEAANRGEIPQEQIIPLMAGYSTAALDTTINSVSTGIWLFATHPDQWDVLRSNPSDPALLFSAYNEILRYDPPIHFFSRVTTRDVDMGEGVIIPKGARVLHSYSSANRDERHFPDPDTFDIQRKGNGTHLGFSSGVHSCAGQGLARLEAQALFKALASRIKHIELAGEPTRVVNNTTRGFAHLPIRVS